MTVTSLMHNNIFPHVLQLTEVGQIGVNGRLVSPAEVFKSVLVPARVQSQVLAGNLA